MRTRDLNHRDGDFELVRLWELSDGTRCVLAIVGTGRELRIVHDGMIVRRAPCVDIRFARHSAQVWRMEYEMEHADAPRATSRVCPDCGDEAVVIGRFPDSVRWLGCGSCGNVWLDETDEHIRDTR